MKTKHQQQVEQFMHLAGQEVPEKPCDPGRDVRLTRAKLILEEALETINGLGFEPHIESWEYGCLAPTEIAIGYSDVVFREFPDFDIIETVDGCCDLAVVATGTLSALGVSDSYIQDAVNRNNLAKFGPGGYRSDGTDGNTAGKWIKPKGHKPPDIASYLREQGWEG